ncbi:MAG: hypothetical protein HQM09_12440 [Candidatus Riflebacteria bacterium]|nr:hypothetical protein [Candidatus Riflebacteria bacterium]
MIRTVSKIALGVMIAAGLLMPAVVTKAEAKGKKKVGVFTRIQRHVKRDCKRVVKKTRRAVVNAGCSVENGVMDSAMKAKSTITGKKNKSTWVKGHYATGNKKHTEGHFRRVKHHKAGGAAPAPAPTAAPAGDPTAAPAPIAPPAGVDQPAPGLGQL